MMTMKRIFTYIALFLTCVVSGAQVKVTSVENVSARTWLCLSSGDGLELSYSDKGKYVPSFSVRPESHSRVDFGQLWYAPDGVLYLYYTETDGYFDGRGVLKSISCTNPSDKTPQWSVPCEIGIGVCTGTPAVAADGSWIMPGALWGRTLIGRTADIYGNDRKRDDNGEYSELDGSRGPLLHISHDMGRTWNGMSGFVTVPEMVQGRYNDPQMINVPDGSLKMVMRSCGTGWSWASTSYDNGQTWSSPEKFVQNPDRKAAFAGLPDGRLLMVKVGKLDEFAYFLGSGLYAYLSDDCGKTWYGGLCIVRDMDADAPSVSCDDEGNITVAYDCGNEVFAVVTSQDEIVRGMSDHEYVAENIRTLSRSGQEKQKASKAKVEWSDDLLRICSYNIKYRNDKLCKWENRLNAIKSFVDEYRPDVIGSQEPYGQQIEDIIITLDGRYGWIGVNNRNEKNPPYHRNGAFNPIFYRKDRVEVLDWDIIWYTPKATERGYGAEYTRFMIWAKMRDRKNGQEFYVFNSHFDHKNEEAKRVSARILVNTVKEVAGNLPAVLTGDFNSTETGVPYATIMDSGFLGNSKLAVDDAVNHMYYSQARYKSINTVSQKDIHIDHIFYTPSNSRIESWELVIKTFGGYYGSDHLPIVTDWRLVRNQ